MFGPTNYYVKHRRRFLVDDGLDPQSALDLPRFCIEAETNEGRVAIEEGMPAETFAGLEKMATPSIGSQAMNAPCLEGDR